MVVCVLTIKVKLLQQQELGNNYKHIINVETH